MPSCSERIDKSLLGSFVGYSKGLMHMGMDNPPLVKVSDAHAVSFFLSFFLSNAHFFTSDAAVLDIQTTWRALAFLESIGAEEEVLDGFRQKASEVFPLSTVFVKRTGEEEGKIRKGLLIPSWGPVEEDQGSKEEN